MRRATFLKTIGAASAGIGSGCSSSAPATAVTAWPPVAFSTARAYAYDCEAEHENQRFVNRGGRIHRGALNPAGAGLSPRHIREVLTLANTPTARDGYKPCYVPHHAIVFYNVANEPVANLEICFTCHRHVATPAGTAAIIDYAALWSMIQELDVPTGRGASYYRDLFRQRNSPAA